MMLGKHPGIFFKATWWVITPVLLLVSEDYTGHNLYCNSHTTVYITSA